MADFPTNTLYYGREDPLPEPVALRAGPLALVYANGDLRTIRLGAREILRRVYVAVRDHNWNTIPPRLSNLEMDVQPDSFRIRYDVSHQQRDIDFFWTGVITGDTDGTITFTMNGEARSTFRRNRVGFCVLHPMDCAGQPVTVEHVGGGVTQGAFPEFIAPYQPFENIRAITHEVAPGVRAEARMEGDTFEMEDQRNWSDASYKTYCTPLALPYPATVEKGTKIAQSITLQLMDDAGAVHVAGAPAALSFEAGTTTSRLPRIGLCVARHGEALTAREASRLRALNLAHLRADISLDQPEPDLERALRLATEQARSTGAALELAVHVTDAADKTLPVFRLLVEKVKPPVASWLVFHRGELSTTARWVRLAREHLWPYDTAARLGAGTNGFFTELNRERPPLDLIDLAAFSLNPQVHAFDNTTLVENLATQAVILESARQFCGGKPLAVSPVTLRMRFNPAATGPELEPLPGALPDPVDPRQMSLLGAGWTVGSLKYLAEGGAFSATFYETTGWLGVMATESGSPLPALFRAIPGGVYPMYHVFADAGAFAGGEVVAGRSSDALIVDGLILHKGGATRALLANFTPARQRVTVRGLRGALRVRSLDETNAVRAMRDPEGFRAEPGRRVEAGADGVDIEMLPFAVVRVDVEHSDGRG